MRRVHTVIIYSTVHVAAPGKIDALLLMAEALLETR